MFQRARVHCIERFFPFRPPPLRATVSCTFLAVHFTIWLNMENDALYSHVHLTLVFAHTFITISNSQLRSVPNWLYLNCTPCNPNEKVVATIPLILIPALFSCWILIQSHNQWPDYDHSCTRVRITTASATAPMIRSNNPIINFSFLTFHRLCGSHTLYWRYLHFIPIIWRINTKSKPTIIQCSILCLLF